MNFWSGSLPDPECSTTLTAPSHSAVTPPASFLPSTYSDNLYVPYELTQGPHLHHNMSLFGSSPPESAPETQSKSSLFDDDQKKSDKSGSGLFDDDGTSGDSPWSMPTPKKGGKADLVKTLLPGSDVPESYIDAFDVLANSDHKADGGRVGIGGAKKLLEGGRVNSEKILGLVTGGTNVTALGRNEFNVLLALVGLAQEGEDATLDGVDERRKSESDMIVFALHSTNALIVRSARAITTLHYPTQKREGL